MWMEMSKISLSTPLSNIIRPYYFPQPSSNPEKRIKHTKYTKQIKFECKNKTKSNENCMQRREWAPNPHANWTNSIVNRIHGHVLACNLYVTVTSIVRIIPMNRNVHSKYINAIAPRRMIWPLNKLVRYPIYIRWTKKKDKTKQKK